MKPLQGGLLSLHIFICENRSTISVNFSRVPPCTRLTHAPRHLCAKASLFSLLSPAQLRSPIFAI